MKGFKIKKLGRFLSRLHGVCPSRRRVRLINLAEEQTCPTSLTRDNKLESNVALLVFKVCVVFPTHSAGILGVMTSAAAYGSAVWRICLPGVGAERREDSVSPDLMASPGKTIRPTSLRRPGWW